MLIEFLVVIYIYSGEAAKDGPCEATLANVKCEMLSLILVHYPVCFIAPVMHSRLFYSIYVALVTCSVAVGSMVSGLQQRGSRYAY